MTGVAIAEMGLMFAAFFLPGMFIGLAIARWQRGQRRLREQARHRLLRAADDPGKEIESMILDRYNLQLAMPRTIATGLPLFAPPLTEAERTQLAMEIRKTFEGPAELVEILPKKAKTTESTAGGHEIPANVHGGRLLHPPLDQS